MARFLGYQHVTRNTQVIYLTKTKLNEFKTKKLLGFKTIELMGDFTTVATHVLDLKAEGVAEVQASYDQVKEVQILHFKLK